MIISDGNDHDLDLFVYARFFRKTGAHPRLHGDMLFTGRALVVTKTQKGITMRMIALPVLSLLCVAIPAQAQFNCDNVTSNAEATECSGREFTRADRELNEVYQEALEIVSEHGTEWRTSAEEWEEKLRASQRAWLAFRDADCKVLTRIEWDGGSGTGLAITTCMTELTRTRIKALRERYGSR
jgi:uncharacterized protein YecT (DUF1311 family)